MTVPLRQHFATIARALRAGTLDTDAAMRLANALDLIAQGQSAGSVLGVKLKPGQHRSQASIDARDDLLREVARKFWPDASTAAQARALCRALADYRNRRWRRDGAADDCPHRGDTLPGHLWRLLRLRDSVPGMRQMRRVLATSSGF